MPKSGPRDLTTFIIIIIIADLRDSKLIMSTSYFHHFYSTSIIIIVRGKMIGGLSHTLHEGSGKMTGSRWKRHILFTW